MMAKGVVVTARLDAETLDLVDRVAAGQGRSRSWFVAEAVRRAAESEADFLCFVQEGRESGDREGWISQDDMKAWWAARKANRRRSAVAAE